MRRRENGQKGGSCKRFWQLQKSACLQGNASPFIIVYIKKLPLTDAAGTLIGKGKNMEHCVEMKKERFVPVHVLAENAVLDGEEVLRVVKHGKLDEFDVNTYAKVSELPFHNGVIEARLLARLLPDAPDFARGFIGIVYRVDEADAEFESFYVRPTNGRSCTDPVRKAHGCQYFSYPGYTFSYFREHKITRYEAQTDIDLNEWITIKAVIRDAHGEFYVNDMEHPVLVVDDMKHGNGRHGSVGIYVDTGTEAFVSGLHVTCLD